MKLAYDHMIQTVTDRLEAASPAMAPLEAAKVIEAVEELEEEGYSLEYVVNRIDLVAQRLSR